MRNLINMGKTKRKIAAIVTAASMAACLAGCGATDAPQGQQEALTYEQATEELNSLIKKVDVETNKDPIMDIYSDTSSEVDALADISTFPLTVTGNGDINIEIAGATEMTSDAPDDWLNEAAREFNKAGKEINGKSVAVSVRQITSGEVVTYMQNDAYSPNVFIPSNEAWGMMLDASGVEITKAADRVAGNTAGILMENSVYEKYKAKYGEPTVAGVIEATLAGDLTFAYTNPYTSSTGLNVIGAILKAFDADNPLSSTAAEKLMEYQQTSPPVAYTTSVLRNQAAKGVINAMVMERQAYANTPTLNAYVYTPVGIRHDHPVYTFGYNTDEQDEAAEMFVEWCLSDEMQEKAKKKGFNLDENYVSDDPGLDGKGWLAAQSIWKENKDGGRPVAAVFVADTSGSMDGWPLQSLQEALINTAPYIGEDNYIGLVSYASSVKVNLPLAKFDASQRAYFSGEVKSMAANGNTATYDAVLEAAKMLADIKVTEPDAKLMMFVLSDGQQNTGYGLSRVTPVIEGLGIPIYTISYNYSDEDGGLAKLSEINESAAINAQSDDVVNKLRNLFNVSL